MQTHELSVPKLITAARARAVPKSKLIPLRLFQGGGVSFWSVYNIRTSRPETAVDGGSERPAGNRMTSGGSACARSPRDRWQSLWRRMNARGGGVVEVLTGGTGCRWISVTAWPGCVRACANYSRSAIFGVGGEQQLDNRDGVRPRSDFVGSRRRPAERRFPPVSALERPRRPVAVSTRLVGVCALRFVFVDLTYLKFEQVNPDLFWWSSFLKKIKKDNNFFT